MITVTFKTECILQYKSTTRALRLWSKMVRISNYRVKSVLAYQELRTYVCLRTITQLSHFINENTEKSEQKALLAEKFIQISLRLRSERNKTIFVTKAISI